MDADGGGKCWWGAGSIIRGVTGADFPGIGRAIVVGIGDKRVGRRFLTIQQAIAIRVSHAGVGGNFCAIWQAIPIGIGEVGVGGAIELLEVGGAVTIGVL